MHYWDQLAEARRWLESGEYHQAEQAYTMARRLRDQSPGRVFLSEKMGDTARKLWRGLRSRPADAEGRWQQETADFVIEFRRHSQTLIEAAASRSASGDPTTTLDYRTLSMTVYLLSVSELTRRSEYDPAQLVLASLRSALLNGILPPAWLIPEAVAYSPDYRLEIADVVVSHLHRHQGAVDSEDIVRLTQTAQRILEPMHFQATPEHHRRRAWISARLTDSLRAEPLAIVAAYREFLGYCENPSPESDIALVRSMGLLCNADDCHLDTPDYAAALELSKSIAACSEASRLRLQELADLIAQRRPSHRRVWASLHEDQQRQCVILWDHDHPCDVFWYRAGWPTEPIQAALAETICVVNSGSIVSNNYNNIGIDEYIEILHESQLPEIGCGGDVVSRLAEAFVPDWDLGLAGAAPHPLLDSGGQTFDPAVSRALAVGLAWLSCLDILNQSHCGLRNGIRRLAKVGDRPSRRLCDFLDPELMEQPDWQLLPLDERPSPRIGFNRDSLSSQAHRFPVEKVALVYTGQPAQAAADWPSAETHARLILDSLTRLYEMAGYLDQAELLTILPISGAVHNSLQALGSLENGWFGSQSHIKGHAFLPLLHWCRISRTHNGDLADFHLLRPRADGALPLHDAYRSLLTQMPVESLIKTGIARAGTSDPDWHYELSERARQSAIVAGWLEYLPDTVTDLPTCWGSADPADITWIFCDSAAVHWRCIRTGLDPRRLHVVLSSHGRRHLSLISGGVFLNDDLTALMSEWLAPYGKLERVKLQDVRPPLMRLASCGIDPDASVELVAAGAGLLEHIRKGLDGGASLAVLLPGSGVPGLFLNAVASGEVSAGITGDVIFETTERLWSRSVKGPLFADRRLLVPMLESLNMYTDADQDVDLAAWPAVDRQRNRALVEIRRLCALEISALASLDIPEIEILDPRWYRRFPFLSNDGNAIFPVPPAEAARLAAGDAVSLCELEIPRPQSAVRKSFRGPSRHGESFHDIARRWLDVQGWLGKDGLGIPPGLPVGVTSGDAQSTGLIIGSQSIQSSWQKLLQDVYRAREAGRLDAWLLVVADEPQPGLVQLRDTFYTPGSTVLNIDTAGQGFGPVFRVDPVSLCDTRAAQLLAAANPAWVWAGDISHWLPGGGRSADLYAPSIRLLLHDLSAPVSLFAADLSVTWQKFLSMAGGKQITIPVSGATRTDRENTQTANLKPVAVGRMEPPETTCPACASVFHMNTLDLHCAGCGLPVGLWLTTGERRRLAADLRRLRIQAVVESLLRDAGDSPICVWHDASDYVPLRAAIADSGLRWRPQNGRTIPAGVIGNEVLLCDVMNIDQPPRECRHYLLAVPASYRELTAFRQATGESVTLWFHPLELSLSDQVTGSTDRSYDMEQFNRVLADLPASTLEDPWRWQGDVPERFLEIISGFPARLVMRALGVESWLLAVEADGRPFGPSDQKEPAGERVRLRLSRMEAEFRLEKLKTQLPLLLNTILPVTTDGRLQTLRLDSLPLEIEPQDLAWFDRLLLAASHHLESPRLYYAAADGLLSSIERTVGVLGDRSRLQPQLDGILDDLGEAVEKITSDEYDFSDDGLLLTGILLGVWSDRGGASLKSLNLDASVPPEASPLLRGTAAQLLNELAGETAGWSWRLIEAWRIGFLEDLQRLAKPSSGTETSEPPQQVFKAAEMIREFLKRGQPGMKVIEGKIGSGRVEAVIHGLQSALQDNLRVGDIQVFCASQASAADFHLSWRSLCPGLQTPRLLVGAGGAETSLFQPGGCISYHRQRAVGVIVETQKHEATDRFRISQRYRQGRLLQVFDPVDARESLEHVFLNMPNRTDVHAMPLSIRHSQKLNAELNDLIELIDKTAPRGKTWFRKRGRVVARHADNLEDALTFLTDDFKNDGAGSLLDVVAPVQDDLVYLGRAAARAGWLPVFRRELDALLMPGATEFLAMVVDACRDPDGDHEDRDWLLPTLAPDVPAKAYRDWLRAIGADRKLPLQEFWLRAGLFCGDYKLFLSRERRLAVEQLLIRQPEGDLGGLLDVPLVEAWRQEISRVPGIPPVKASGPVFTLSTSGEVPVGRDAPRAVFCLGTESPRDHYRLLAGAADPVYILYKVQSPLVGDLAGEA